MSSSTPTRVKGVRLDVDLDKMGEGFMSSMKAVGNSVSKVGEGIVDVTKKVGDGVVDGAKKVGDGAKDLSSKVVEPLKASPRLPSTPASMHAPVAAPDDFWKGTTCLVIGGAGNLGGHIVQLLLERSARVASFDLVAYSGESTEVASFVGSVTDRAALEAAMEGVGVVIHTASIIDLRPIPSLRMQQINVAGTYEVVGACKACGVHTLVYTSSIEVVSGVDEHGVTRLIDGVDESAPIPPRHHLPYAATKAAAERLVLAAHSPRGLRTVAIRSAYIFGANSLGQRIEMVRAHDRRGHYVTAKVPATLSTVHAKNCALAHLRAAERADKADVGGKPFFVRDFEANVVEMNLECFAGTPIKVVLLPLWLAYGIAFLLHYVDIALHALVALLARLRPNRGWARSTPDEVLDIRAVGMAWIDIAVSDKRAREVLGYEPIVSKAECMREATEWCETFYAQLSQKKLE